MKRIFYVFMLLLVALSACKNGKQEVVQDETVSRQMTIHDVSNDQSNPCVTLLLQVYNDYVLFGVKKNVPPFETVVDKVFTNNGKQKLKDAWEYVCEGECYDATSLRTGAQDGPGESEIINILSMGNNQYIVVYRDMGWIGETLFTFVEDKGQMKIDDYQRIYDENDVEYLKNKEKETSNTVTDYDGNVYNTIQIGDQIWMKENLRTTHFADGKPIGMGSKADYEKELRYAPDGEASNVKKYGYLYNWKAVKHGITNFDSMHGEKGICPEGWHVPTQEEFEKLEEVISSIVNDINISVFSAVPAGSFGFDGFSDFGDFAYFWCATPTGSARAFSFFLSNDDEYFRYREEYREIGYSVRCLKGQ